MKSLSAQLSLRLLITCALLFGAAGAALYWHVAQDMVAEFDASLRVTARALAAATEEDEGRIRLDLSSGSMPQVEQPMGSEVYVLRAEDGREIARSRSLGAAALPLAPGTPGTPSVFNTTLPDGRVLRCASLLFTISNEEGDHPKMHAPPKSKVLLLVGRDRRPLEKTLAAIRSSMLLVGACALGVLAALIHLGVRAGLRPVNQLGVRVSKVNAGSLATRFSVDSLPAELHPIVASLNELLSRLGAAFKRERRFTATAAHEFRTPLAELRSVAEVNLSLPASEAERDQSWRDVLAVTARMQSLAGCLLDLARTENPADSLQFQRISLSQALHEAWSHRAKTAAARKVRLVPDIPGRLSIETEPALLGVILGNLCGNAAEHAPEGASLFVTAQARTASVQLLFRNKAADISEADIQYLFERFWRKNPARNDYRHHGLGLAISSETAKLLGGSLSARLMTGGEIEFLLTLPATACL